ncbi:hypothetical protein QVD17_17586 [Tagetes erecta]|uniref:Uncharacterized protein n=1 Tax=Tagetes erecta TaxID=13708 RepID=A0AAD8P1N3_TARER|nr:hypothetical protein QVD17_17586 [Tagetes erecta]
MIPDPNPNASSSDNAENNLLQRLLSFLEVQNSFLTPWSFDPSTTSDQTSNAGNFMMFQPGSFFTHEPTTMEPTEDRCLMAPEEESTLAQPGAVLEPDQDQSPNNKEVTMWTKPCVIT